MIVNYKEQRRWGVLPLLYFEKLNLRWNSFNIYVYFLETNKTEQNRTKQKKQKKKGKEKSKIFFWNSMAETYATTVEACDEEKTKFS